MVLSCHRQEMLEFIESRRDSPFISDNFEFNYLLDDRQPVRSRATSPFVDPKATSAG